MSTMTLVAEGIQDLGLIMLILSLLPPPAILMQSGLAHILKVFCCFRSIANLELLLLCWVTNIVKNIAKTKSVDIIVETFRAPLRPSLSRSGMQPGGSGSLPSSSLPIYDQPGGYMGLLGKP